MIEKAVGICACGERVLLPVEPDGLVRVPPMGFGHECELPDQTRSWWIRVELAAESVPAPPPPELRPPTRWERLCFALVGRWPESYVRARLDHDDAARKALGAALWEGRFRPRGRLGSAG